MSTLLSPQPATTDIDGVSIRPPKRRSSPLWAWLFGLWVISGAYIVPADQQALVTRLGAVANPRVPPGIHYALPWPIDSVYKIKVRQLQRTIIGGEVADLVLGRANPASSEFLSGDQNLLNARAVVQYSVREPRDYLFQTAEVDKFVRLTVESEFARRIARTPVDAILTTDKIAIQNDVLQGAQRALDAYACGVTISSVNIDDVTPPAEAADAFRAVAGARADAIRLVNEAEGYANDLIPKARGEAAQMAEDAQAYKDGKVNRATGDALRFAEIAAEYAKAPKLTATRAYIEAMEQILPKIRKIVLDSQGNLDVTIIGREGNATPTAGGDPQK